MGSPEQLIYYTSEFGKHRAAPSDVAIRETKARREFLNSFIPELQGYFQKRGVVVLIDVIGSVANGAAIETSDIDLLIREYETENLERVRTIGIEVRARDLNMRKLPFDIHYWYDHPIGSEAYYRLIKQEEAEL